MRARIAVVLLVVASVQGPSPAHAVVVVGSTTVAGSFFADAPVPSGGQVTTSWRFGGGTCGSAGVTFYLPPTGPGGNLNGPNCYIGLGGTLTGDCLDWTGPVNGYIESQGTAIGFFGYARGTATTVRVFGIAGYGQATVVIEIALPICNTDISQWGVTATATAVGVLT